ncbi:bifunctional diaminohydroxyphosphoribosylaminopyrimidine deaminase/5-amino-6-(5-phosphoribosylamino)uracil reductase RibD [bacterium]|nr:bifunctional diaminohydroxyphosphoribosylaminopyrimidine deaminase/5-amino-6-(5-phosphoribosylamino)uracil reductase RibD [bacterium]MBU1984467.1 bifunctional diaminohydroxyphosphoribosylaminopyrimidine deaminase/5-amino-6-(5-phosphoribosylamino)uracil reductase RibD [bacterium]
MKEEDARRRSDERFMRMALREAVKGRGFTSPNPMVGAVAVKDGQVLGKACHRRFGGEHAEIALIRALSSDEARDATIYVNLEPCCHVGKTPPCTDALIRARVARVVIGHEDPNPLVQGRGIRQLREAGIEVETGVIESEAREVNAPFLTYITEGRPWILLKVAQSLDGRIALANGQSRWITGERSRKEVHRLRAELDAVMVGSQTVIEDNPELTVRHIRGRNPLRIIVDSLLRIHPDARVLHQADAGRTWILTTPEASLKNRRRIEETGATLLDCPAGADGKVDLREAMRLLAQHGITSLFVEGGGTLHASFIRAGLCDRFIVAMAAILIGSDGKPAIWELELTDLAEAPSFRLSRTRRFDEDIWLEFERNVHGNR